MSEYSTSFSKNSAFQINFATLADIVQVVKGFLEEDPKISIKLDGDHQIEDRDLNVLIADNYVKNRYIRSIIIEGQRIISRSSETRARSIRVEFEVALMQVVDVRISGDRDQAVSARNELETILGGVTLWYSFLFLPHGFMYFAASMSVPIVLLSILTVYFTLLFGGEVNGTSISALAIPVGFVIFSGFYLLKDRLFPKLLFDIGRSALRIQYARYWRNLILSSILIGIFVKIAIDRLLK